MKPYDASPLVIHNAPVLVLVLCRPDESDDGIVWPTSGPVTALDWDAKEEKRNGFYGWLHGMGSVSGGREELFYMVNARWLVVEVPVYIQLNGIVRFPTGIVVCSGSREEAIAYLLGHGCKGAVIGNYMQIGDFGTAEVGDFGVAKVGMNGTAIAGDNGRATAGIKGNAKAGTRGRAIAGDYGYAQVLSAGTASAGFCGSAMGEDYSRATVGDFGNAFAGKYGMATAGDYGEARADFCGRAMAGERGKISIQYMNTENFVYINGSIGITRDMNDVVLRPYTIYRVNSKGKFTKVLKSNSLDEN